MSEEAIAVRVKKTLAQFRKIRDPKARQIRGRGTFFLHLEITAPDKDVYIPLSVASGKKPTGFIYRIEGTAQSSLATDSVAIEKGAGTQVTLGTIRYAKIPAHQTATFRVTVEMTGKAGEEYQIVISCINYKLDPSAARYERFLEEIPSETLGTE